MSIPTAVPVGYTSGDAVISADGTRITYLAIGTGPTTAVLHGQGHHSEFALLARAIADGVITP